MTAVDNPFAGIAHEPDGQVLAITMAEYLELDAVSRSDLKLIGQETPLAWKWQQDRPQERKRTPAMDLGDAVHRAVLEPDLFETSVAVYEGKQDDRIEAWRDFEAEHEGWTILKPAQYERAIMVRDAVARARATQTVLRQGLAEQALLWTDPDTGEPVKSRPDFWNLDRGYVVDVKTTYSLKDKALDNAVAEHAYDVQAAMWHHGSAELPDEAPSIKHTYHLWVATEGPPDFRLRELSADWLESGSLLFQEWLHTYHVCKRKNEWPGYTKKIEPHPMPHRLRKRREKEARA